MSTKKIVFIDDDPTSKIMARRASGRLDCEFLFFERALDVLDNLDMIDPKLVVLDLAMTDMNGIYDQKAGITVSRILRQRYGDRFPILILTGMENPQLICECLRGGADDYYVKSHKFSGIVKRIAAWLVVDYLAGDPAQQRENAADALENPAAGQAVRSVGEWRQVAMREICHSESGSRGDAPPARPLGELFAWQTIASRN